MLFVRSSLVKIILFVVGCLLMIGVTCVARLRRVSTACTNARAPRRFGSFLLTCTASGMGRTRVFLVFLDVFLSGKMEEKQRWMVTLWCIWLARNRKAFERKQSSPDEVHEEAKTLLKEFLEYKECVARPAKPSQAGDRKWTRPGPGFVKMNCDAAVLGEVQSTIAFVGRNDRGEFLLAGAKQVQP